MARSRARTVVRGANATHPCPAKGCRKTVRKELLACLPHWYALPAPLRDEIKKTAAARQHRPYVAAVLQARKIWAGSS